MTYKERKSTGRKVRFKFPLKLDLHIVANFNVELVAR